MFNYTYIHVGYTSMNTNNETLYHQTEKNHQYNMVNHTNIFVL